MPLLGRGLGRGLDIVININGKGDTPIANVRVWQLNDKTPDGRRAGARALQLIDRGGVVWSGEMSQGTGFEDHAPHVVVNLVPGCEGTVPPPPGGAKNEAAAAAAAAAAAVAAAATAPVVEAVAAGGGAAPAAAAATPAVATVAASSAAEPITKPQRVASGRRAGARSPEGESNVEESGDIREVQGSERVNYGRSDTSEQKGGARVNSGRRTGTGNPEGHSDYIVQESGDGDGATNAAKGGGSPPDPDPAVTTKPQRVASGRRAGAGKSEALDVNNIINNHVSEVLPTPAADFDSMLFVGGALHDIPFPDCLRMVHMYTITRAATLLVTDVKGSTRRLRFNSTSAA